MNCAVVLFHFGKKSMDPKTKMDYDPWKSHILHGLKQLRIWNPNIPVYFIVDEDVVEHEQSFSKLRIEIVKASDISLQRDLSCMDDYFSEEVNPLWKTSFIRFFYIEQLMKSKNLTNVFTFDNDVLIYCNFEDFVPILNESCGHTAITRIDQNGFICGMMWIRNPTSISVLNDNLINLVNEKENKRTTECNLLHKAWMTGGNSLISSIPTWFSGFHSMSWEQYGGIFDPATIGQMMGGCHNGSPTGTIMIHHEIGILLKQFIDAGGSVVKLEDADKRFYALSDGKNFICKINSIHMHSKNLKEFVDV